jgi:pilus assembly protein TadC
MISSNFNSRDLGKLLIPKKILSISYEKALLTSYQNVFFSKLDYSIITNIFSISFFASLIAYLYIYSNFLVYMLSDETIWLELLYTYFIWLILNLLIYYLFLLYYYFSIENKFNKNKLIVENAMPEFLDSLLSNIKGGNTIEESLLKSCPPNNPIFLKEISQINTKIVLGKSLDQALIEFEHKFNSEVLNRTFTLLLEGLKEGGDIEKPLDKISENLKNIYYLNKELVASTSGFVVIIKSISLVVTPILFALSLTLLTFINDLFSLFQDSKIDFIASDEVPDDFFLYLKIFSYVMIITISFFSSLIIANLKSEDFLASIKYLLINIAIGIFLYNILSSLLLSAFGSIL